MEPTPLDFGEDLVTNEQEDQIIVQIMTSSEDELISPGISIGLKHPGLGKTATRYLRSARSPDSEACLGFLKGIILAALVFELEKGNCKKSEEVKETNDSGTSV